MNIVVLAGGLSPERNVSLTSGSLIAAALRRKGHRVLLLDVYMGTVIDGDPLSLFTFEQKDSPPVGDTIPDLEDVKRQNGGARELIGRNVLFLCSVADAVFIALHGDMGENGKLQATLDNFDIKYTGSGYIGSLLAMDKDLAKKMFTLAGIPTPPWIYFDTRKPLTKKVLSEIEYPCVVKPVSCGSSVGVSIVSDEAALKHAITEAKKFEDFVLIERKIEGREFTSGILNGKVLPPVEIIPKSGFYDYKNKYQKGATTEICPAQLTKKQLGELEKLTRKGFETLRLAGYVLII